MKLTDNRIAFIYLAVLVSLTYGPVVFGPHTLANTTTTDLGIALYYEGRTVYEYATIDAGAHSWVIYPLEKLAIRMMASGEAPLWDPYTACGKPFSSDPVVGTYSITSLFYFFGPYAEDVRFILRLLIAAVGMFLFLREHEIRWSGAMAGSVVFSLSGPFTLLLQHNSTESTMLTPLILLGIERLLRARLMRRTKTSTGILIVGVALAISLLGAHLETLILQYSFAGLYIGLRLLQVKGDLWSKIANGSFETGRDWVD